MLSAVTKRVSSGDDATLISLGDRLRAARKIKGMTLKNVAEMAGFSVGFISQVERGITVPSIVSLMSISRVLDVDAHEFLSSFRPVSESDSKRVGHSLASSGSGAMNYERLTAEFRDNTMHGMVIYLPPGLRGAPVSHNGEEIFFILTGELTLEVAGKRSVLRSGDSAHFKSTCRHATWNHTAVTTVLLHICTDETLRNNNEAPAPDGFVAVTRGERNV